MCGITGIMAFNMVGDVYRINVNHATKKLHSRGPDFQSVYSNDKIALGHARLSIIDTSSNGNQPMWDKNNRYAIVFNGEIYNFKELKKKYFEKDFPWKSTNDTEVLLELYVKYKEGCLKLLNGFFAFAIYDAVEHEIFLSRDRFGIKPLYYFLDDDKLIFGSQIGALESFNALKELDHNSLYQYFHFNYIPENHSSYQNCKRLEKGSFIRIKKDKSTEKELFYELSRSVDENADFNNAKKKVRTLLFESVEKRLVSDVPLGTFLSGGLDSSIITFIASKLKSDITSFSLGFPENNYLDESQYAKITAEHLGIEHKILPVYEDEIIASIDSILESIDEPFADSSAIAVYLLSKKTKEHVTVALSGDGADELFAGYNKYKAEFKIRNDKSAAAIAALSSPFLKFLPQSRFTKIQDTARKVIKFNEGLKMSDRERYYQWSGFLPDEVKKLLFNRAFLDRLNDYEKRKKEILKNLSSNKSINDWLFADFQLVLPSDMLTKVDRMSMANGLEIRVPFLDHHLVDYVFSLPESFKIKNNTGKWILREAFKKDLPDFLNQKSKRGFEVPLNIWFKGKLRDRVTNYWLSDEKIKSAEIFDLKEISKIKDSINTAKGKDYSYLVWALIVLLNWNQRKHLKN